MLSAARTQVENVALWTGLIVGIVSVVLAVVAIYFSIEVDRRSTNIATETSRALERIEGDVKRQSQDTRELIKVGWERMLPIPESPTAPREIDEQFEQIAAVPGGRDTGRPGTA